MQEPVLHFADAGAGVDDLLLFSVDGGRAIEVTRGGFEFDQSVPALYEGSKVTKPVPVMVEGVYHVFDRSEKKFKEVKITAEDIVAYHKNTPRDVAINYEHKHGGEPKGWLRLRDTASVKPVKTRDGERMALFASLELFPEAADAVARGAFRDGSIELRPYSKEIVGQALTAYPVMRDVQFYGELSADDPNTPVVETPPNPTEDQVTPEQALQAALEKFGLKPEDLQMLPALIASAEKDKRDARLITARAKVQEFATGEDGKVRLTGPALEAAAQLYAYGTENDTLEFGDGDDKASLTGLVEKLIRGVEAIQVFGESAGVSAEHIQGVVPVIKPDETVNADRVAALKSRIKGNLARAQQ